MSVLDLPEYVEEAMDQDLLIEESPRMALLEYQEKFLDVEFKNQLCPSCREEVLHRVEVDHYLDRTRLECGACNGIREVVPDGGIPDELIKACPECDHAPVAPTQPGNPHTPDHNKPDGEYRCTSCGAGFDQPNLRKRRGTGSRRGLAGDLEQLEPDDLPVGEPLTDGGTTVSWEEFQRRKRQHSTTPKDQVRRCPHCKSPDVRSRDPQPKVRGQQAAGEWYCGHCSVHVEPLEPGDDEYPEVDSHGAVIGGGDPEEVDHD